MNVAEAVELMPRLLKQHLRTEMKQVTAYIEKYIYFDDGPIRPKRFTSRTGEAHRGYIIGSRSNRTKIESTKRGKLTLTITNLSRHAAFLEHGTKHMEARPALSPGLKRYKRERLSKVLKAVIHDFARHYNARA